MIKQCVKKPFTVLVAVIICLTLAAVSLTRMGTDLLPEMNLPYMVVITTYPGASPEKVETNVSAPMEGQLGSVSHVKTVTSTSSENYSMVMLEFEDDTDMDSAMVKVRSALDAVPLPEECGEPNIMEISMDMMATTYLAVSYDDKDLYELSDFVEDNVSSYYERQEGVSNVTTTGLVEESVEVRLNQKKIDKINNKILQQVNDKLADAKEEIDSAQSELDEAQAELDEGSDELESQKNDTANQLGEASLGLNQALATQSAYEAQLNSQLANQSALEMEKEAYEDAGVVDSYEQLNQLFGSLKDAVSGEEAYQTLYDTIYQKILVETVQGMATSNNMEVEVTAENVDEILGLLGEETATQIKTAAAETAKAVAEAQLKESGDNLPTSVEDALANPDKLEAAVELLKSQGQEDVAAQLTTENLSQLNEIVNTRIPQIDTELANLKVEIAAAQAVTENVTSAVSEALESYSQVEAGKILAAAGLGAAEAQLAAGQSALESGQEQLDSALGSFEESKKTALKNANIDALLEMDTLSGILYAQNFSMPAGYVDDAEDNQWMLKIGDPINSLEALQELLLTHVDGVGDIRLQDVADITVIDNAGESYTKVNGQNAVVLQVYKNSTSSTSAVSKVCQEASAELEAEYEGLHVSTLMDQGDYIEIFINNIVSSMVIGALLAVVVLAVFLKDVLPTLVVAFAIPFSVLVSVLLMYFSGITMNMMSMGGLALGIGMLVDNSIVVIENIFRLRNRGLPAPRASVQGAKQVDGAIVASTLTTVCVFLPMIFTSGLTRQLMLPFALTIAFSLLASLVVALTVVPTIASVLFRKTKPKAHPWFDKLLEVYGRLLDFCLRVKVVPLGLAVILLAGSIFGVTRMGIVLIPDMASDSISITVNCEDESISQEDGYAMADQIMERILDVEQVDMVGGMGNTGSLLTTMTSNDYSTYSFYVVPDESVTKEKQVYALCDQIEEAVADLKGVEISVSASSIGSVSTIMGSGLTINLYGDDLEQLLKISEDVEDIVAQVDGFEEITNSQEEADETLHLVIDKDKAMGYGLTVAQIYQQIMEDLTTEDTATTITMDEQEMDVVIVNENHLPTKENLLGEEFETTVVNDEGEQETETHQLKEFAKLENQAGYTSINRENNVRYMTVSATTKENYNTTKQAEKVKALLEEYDMPEGYVYELSGEYENVNDMVIQMLGMIALGFLFIYLVMVAQFQSLLSPFIILFTVPLAFTGGFFGLLFAGEQLSLLALMGFLVLMGTVVNNGIVFVDYANQLRLGGMKKRDALIATGKTRMRPILMTAMTTILSMAALIFDASTSAGLSRGMAIVVAGGLIYATLMTLFIVPVMYDILFRKQPSVIDVGDDTIDDAPDDAAEFIAELGLEPVTEEKQAPKKSHRRFWRRKKKNVIYDPKASEQPPKGDQSDPQEPVE